MLSDGRILVLSRTTRDTSLLGRLATIATVEEELLDVDDDGAIAAHPILRRLGLTSRDTLIFSHPQIFLVTQDDDELFTHSLSEGQHCLYSTRSEQPALRTAPVEHIQPALDIPGIDGEPPATPLPPSPPTPVTPDHITTSDILPARPQTRAQIVAILDHKYDQGTPQTDLRTTSITRTHHG